MTSLDKQRIIDVLYYNNLSLTADKYFEPLNLDEIIGIAKMYNINTESKSRQELCNELKSILDNRRFKSNKSNKPAVKKEEPVKATEPAVKATEPVVKVKESPKEPVKIIEPVEEPAVKVVKEPVIETSVSSSFFE